MRRLSDITSRRRHSAVITCRSILYTHQSINLFATAQCSVQLLETGLSQSPVLDYGILLPDIVASIVVKFKTFRIKFKKVRKVQK